MFIFLLVCEVATPVPVSDFTCKQVRIFNTNCACVKYLNYTAKKLMMLKDVNPYKPKLTLQTLFFPLANVTAFSLQWGMQV